MKNSISSGKSTAKDVFAYLLMIITLYVSIFAFIALIWQYINVSFPDALQYYSSATDIMRSAISALIVVWPVFLGISWFINRELSTHEEKKDIWVRKWLLYLTLFIAAITIIVNLITLTNNFLGGELTTRFVLKALVILVVAFKVFGYYLWELRRDPQEETKLPLISSVVASVVLIGWIIAGFFIVGTPAEQRATRLDIQRVSDLNSLQYNVIDYWNRTDALPEDLSALTNMHVPTDPATGEMYSYTVTGDLSFELCATFATDSDERNQQDRFLQPGYYSKSIDYSHEAGYHCFQHTIDPELDGTQPHIR